jgi:hypothetical protein
MTAPAEPDVLIELDQLELPDDFADADLDELRTAASRAEVRADVTVRPGADVRDPLVLATLFVVHFVTAHGLEIALGVAEGALWDGIKATFQRLRGRTADTTQVSRVGVTYPDGRTLVVEVHSADELVRVVRELGPHGAAGPPRT